MDSKPVSIGQLRWLVTLARRDEAPAFDTGITDTITPIEQKMYASIEPVGGEIFMNSEQTDTPITHRVFVRWRDYFDLQYFNVILREMQTPSGETRNETFRIQRISEVNGRQRYNMIECELESANSSSSVTLSGSASAMTVGTIT